MKAKEKVKVAAVRAIQTAVKQKEVDERIEITEEMITSIVSKLIKQRKESVDNFLAANRPLLAEAEKAEIDVLQTYLPAQLSDEELNIIIDEAIVKVEAKTIKDTRKVMDEIKLKVAGRVDMSKVGKVIQAKINKPK